MKKILILALAAIFLLPVLPLNAQARTEIIFEDSNFVDVSKPLVLTLKTAEVFDKAIFYLDGSIVAEYEDDGNRERVLEIDLSEAPYLGQAEFSAVVHYETLDKVTKSIYLTKLKKDIKSVFSEDFKDTSPENPNPAFNYNTNIDANAEKISLEHYVYDGNKALEVRMNSSITSKEPFMLKDGLAVFDGSNITVEFDVCFALTNRAYLKLETRDLSTSKYPTNEGASMPVLPLFKGATTIGENEYLADTWYNCKVVMDTICKGLKFYIKTSAQEEYTLDCYMPEYNCVGLNQIRFCFGSLNSDGGSVILDNINVFAQSEDSVWYAKPVYKDAENNIVTNESFSVKDGKIELSFSKAVNGSDIDGIKIYNEASDAIEYVGEYNAETFVYTIIPKKALRYTGEYTINISDSVKAIDGSQRLSDSEIKFRTERYPAWVSSCENTSGGIKLTVEGYSSITDETAVAYTMKNNMLHSANMIKLSSDTGVYNLSLTKPSGDYKLYVLIMNSKDRLTVNEVYIND